METYGRKKKKSFMGSFAALRDSQYAKSKKNRASKRDSLNTILSAWHHEIDSIVFRLGNQANMGLSAELSTRQLSAFHSTTNIEKQETVEESPKEHNNGLSDETTMDHPSDATPTIENTLPQLPSLNFSEKEMWIAAKGTLTESNNSNGDHAENPPSHARKSSAPPIPRKSSRRKSGLSKPARRRSPTKDLHHRRFPKEPIARSSSGFDDRASPLQPVVSPSDPNAINASIAQTFRAMEELKPGSTNTLVVEKKRRLKGGAFLKVKNVLQGSFRRRKNDNSQEDSLVNPPLVNSPSIQEQIFRCSESISDKDLRTNEGNSNSNLSSV
ncbi:hypothetical protein NHQ30_008806 [Ciborinia camelliae]|nr:hypothetical protein NHQ30_008806 [Ciborinia camelliae]